MKRKVLVIVAHPDDETIWMGGTLLKNNWDLTIISLCRKYDRDRAPKFKKACKIFKARCFMSDLEDEALKPIALEEATERIQKFVKGGYDYIFTHGANGEYGHIRHKLVHKAVKALVEKKILTCEKLFFFSYIKKGRCAYPSSNANKFINIKQSSFNKKKNLILNVYGFDKNTFEERCCGNKEAFDLMEK